MAKWTVAAGNVEEAERLDGYDNTDSTGVYVAAWKPITLAILL